jgi:hypothetical protein
LHRLGPYSKLIYVSRRNDTFRPETALSLLVYSLAGLPYRLATRRVFCPENMIDRQHLEVEFQGRHPCLILQHLDVRRFVYTCNGSKTLVLHRLEGLDQSVSVGSFVPAREPY